MKIIVKGSGFIFFIILFVVISPSVFAEDLFLNEIFPNPFSGEKEWIEFYNSRESSIDLLNYYLDDDDVLLVLGEVQKGTEDPGSDPIKLEGVLNSKLTCFVNLSSYLNNDEDKPTIFQSDGTVLDTYVYVDSVQNKSFSRIPDGGEWQTNQDSTKSNIECSSLVPVLTPTPTPSLSSAPTFTPTLTTKPTSTIKPSSTIRAAVNTPLPTFNKISFNNPTSVLLTTKKPSLVVSKNNTPTPKKLVLGDNEKPTDAQEQKKEVKIASITNNFPKILIGLGSFLIIACGILLFRSWKMKEKT